jgi:hypothetical protein
LTAFFTSIPALSITKGLEVFVKLVVVLGILPCEYHNRYRAGSCRTGGYPWFVPTRLSMQTLPNIPGIKFRFDGAEISISKIGEKG